MAAESLAANEGLSANTSEEVADAGQGKEHSCSNQTRLGPKSAQELDECHDSVCGSSRIVGGDLADHLIKLARRRADAKQQRHFDEEDHKG